MSNIKVSIIVPIYNVEKYLRDCLDSIIRQSYENIQVVLVDDGSTDSSGTIAIEYTNKYPYFTLITKENWEGVSEARNTGIPLAEGDYIYFLDSDDYITDTAIEELVVFACKNELDLVKLGAEVFSDENRMFDEQFLDIYRYKGKYEGIYPGQEFLRKALDNQDKNPTCGMHFYKRSIIEQKGIVFPKGILYEDNLFHLKYITFAKRVAVYDKPLYKRRVRAGSITQTSDKLNLINSYIITIQEAVLFINNSVSIKDLSVYERLLISYTNIIIRAYMKLSAEERGIINNEMDCLHNIIKNNDYWRDKNIKLWFEHKMLFRCKEVMINFAKKIYNRNFL